MGVGGGGSGVSEGGGVRLGGNVTVTKNGVLSATYSYDLNGNRLSKATPTTTETSGADINFPPG